MTGNENATSSLCYARDKKALINEKSEKPEVYSVVSLTEILSHIGKSYMPTIGYKFYQNFKYL